MKVNGLPLFVSFGLVIVAVLLGASYSQITDPKVLSDPLVKESRAALLRLGFSERFFDQHFTLIRFTGDLDKLTEPHTAQQILWQFSIGEYQTTVDDNIGFTDDKKGMRHSVHSLAPDLNLNKNLKLPIAHDIKRVISRERAERLIRACVGSINNDEQVYLNLFDFHHTGLLLLTSSYFAVCGPAGSTLPCAERNGIVNLETGETTGCNRSLH